MWKLVDLSIRFISSIKGANFCQVKIRKTEYQFKPETTLGTQKWKGKIPSLTLSPRIKIRPEKDLAIIKGIINFIIPPNISNPLPAAWIQKYFKVDSLLKVETPFLSLTNKGIKPKNESSIPTQQINQFEEETATTGPKAIIK